VDLLIADVTLPTGSGIHVALEVQFLLPYSKIIIMSGYPPVMWNDQDSAELEELPSDSVITLQKPFLLATLLDSVHRFLGLPISVAPALQMKAASQNSARTASPSVCAGEWLTAEGTLRGGSEVTPAG